MSDMFVFRSVLAGDVEVCVSLIPTGLLRTLLINIMK
jgi:hypothetical protein